MIMHKNDNSTLALFSVRSFTKAGIRHTWNFILQENNTLLFVGKTTVQRKHNSNKKDASNNATIDKKAQFIIEADTSFSLQKFTYLPEHLSSYSYVEVYNCTSRPEKKTLEWFANIAPLLLAIEHKDSLLAAELFHNKASVFMQFPSITIKLLEPISIEGLFSWVWGRFDNNALHDVELIYSGKCIKAMQTWGVAETFFTASRRRLAIEMQANEKIEDCLTRYFKSHRGTKLTLGIVGSKHYRWVEKKLHTLEGSNHHNNSLFSKTKTSVVVESDNEHDKNAVAVYLSQGQTGYIRKTGSEILRKAFPSKMQFTSKLARLGNTQAGKNGIVIEIVI